MVFQNNSLRESGLGASLLVVFYILFSFAKSLCVEGFVVVAIWRPTDLSSWFPLSPSVTPLPLKEGGLF